MRNTHWALAVLFTSLLQTVCPLPDVIRIGGLFDSDDEAHEVAFISAVKRINRNNDILPHSRLLAQVERIPPHDSFEASRRVCSLMSIGVAAIFGPQSADTSAHVQSICDALDVPHIETRWDVGFKPDVYSINLYPHPPTLSKAYEDLAHHWGWKTFAILYEDNDGLVRLQDLFKTATRTFYTIGVRKLPPGDNYRAVLRELKKLGHTRIIVDCNTDKVFRVLKQAQQVGMMTDQHHYLVTSLDMDTVDLEDFRYGGTNISSLRLVDPNRAEVVRVVSALQSSEKHFERTTGNSKRFMLKTETALIFDAVYLFAKALHDLDSSQHIDVKPLSCESEEPWVPGNSLINYMKVVQMDGLSGIVGFDTNGFRSHFALDIVELHKSGLQNIGFWSTGSDFKDKKVIGLNITKVIEKISDGSLKRRHLNVTTLLSRPYAMIKDSPDQQTGNNRFEGYCIDLIDEISKLLEFNYTIFEVHDKTHGRLDPATNEWNGIIGAVKHGKADMGIGDVTITLQRESAVDFTTPFMNLGISILFRKPRPAPPSLLSFLSPFSNDVWLYMCISYMGVSLVLFILARLSPYEWDNPYPCIQEPDVLQNDFGLLNSMWFTIGSLMQQGSDIAPKAASTRLVAGIWWLFTLIMISSYTANLAAFLTVENKEIHIENVEQLAKQTKIKYGCMASGSTQTFFQDSNIEIYQQMWSVMAADPSVFTIDNPAGQVRVEKEDYAFFMESNSIEYITETHCKLMQVGGLLDNKGYGIALPKGSAFRNEISAAILKLQERGVLQALKTKWWKQKQKAGEQCKDASSSSIKALGLSNVGGIFVVLLVGMGTACLAAAAEFIWKTQKVASHERGSLYQEMMKELKFAMSCKGSKKLEKKRPSEPENGLAMPLSKYSFNDRDIFT